MPIRRRTLVIATLVVAGCGADESERTDSGEGSTSEDAGITGEHASTGNDEHAQTEDAGGSDSSGESPDPMEEGDTTPDESTAGFFSANGLPVGVLQTVAEELDPSRSLEEQLPGRFSKAVVDYVIACALPEGSTALQGVAQREGAMGVAPQWQTGACDPECQRWMTACLLAHANSRNHDAIPLYLKSNNAAWPHGMDADLRDGWWGEAAWFGNIWKGKLLYCEYDGISEPIRQILDQRICSDGQCPFRKVGYCRPSCTRMGDADELGYWGECSDNNSPLPTVTSFLSLPEGGAAEAP